MAAAAEAHAQHEERAEQWPAVIPLYPQGAKTSVAERSVLGMRKPGETPKAVLTCWAAVRAPQRKLAEIEADDSERIFGRATKPIRMRGTWSCKGTLVHYEAADEDTASEAFWRCHLVAPGWYGEACCNEVRKCTDQTVRPLVYEHSPFGYRPGV